jgi:hypothetical protein
VEIQRLNLVSVERALSKVLATWPTHTSLLVSPSKNESLKLSSSSLDADPLRLVHFLTWER